MGAQRGGGGPRRRASVVRARLLRPRQRVLRGVGRDFARPRVVHRVDARTRARAAAGIVPRPRLRDGARPMSGPWSAAEMMTVAAARALTNDDVCFVGIGLPSAACNLA